MKIKFAKSILDAFSEIVETSNGKPNHLDRDDNREYVNNFFSKFLRISHIKRFSRYTDKGASSAERFIKSIRNFSTKPVFEKGKADWFIKLPSVINQYIDTIHS